MMDFKLIMTLVGLGLLVLVSLFALLGFFGGIKREWKCTAVAFVLVILAMLVFGDSSLILNMKGGFLKGMLSGIPDSAETVWDCILAYVRNQIENGAVIFAEGTKAYAFLYNVVAGIARGAALVVGVFVIMVIVMIANGIYRLIAGIHGKKVKKQKAAEAAEEEADEPTLSEGVLISSSTSEGDAGSVVATDKNADRKGDGNHRGWAAFIAGLRAIIVIIILFAPIAGVCTVLNEVTPETEQFLRDVMNGSSAQTANEPDVIDLAMDFKDAYYGTVTGKAIESSAKFFKDSFSTQLFDSAFSIKTETGKLTVRKELIVLVNAINQLEGHSKLDDITQEEWNNALDALKDSDLLVEIMPVVIEVANNYPFLADGKTLGDILKDAGTQAEFLALKNADWDKNLETILDAAKYVKELGILDKDFNYLTMDPDKLGEMLDTLIESDVVENILDIAVKTALKNDDIIGKIGVEKFDVDMSNFDWKQELQDLVHIYDEFQDLGITSLNNLDLNQLVDEIVNDDAKFDTAAAIISDLFDTQIMKDIGIQIGLEAVANLAVVKDAGTDLQQQVKDLKNVDWSSDVPKYLEAVKEALDFLDFSDGIIPKVDYLHMDPDDLQDVVDKLFETESFEKILPIATNIALSNDKVKELIGEDVVINTANIDWEQDFTKLVDVYDEFLKLGIDDIKDVTADPIAFAKEVLKDDVKTDALVAVLDTLADTDLFQDVLTPVAESIANKKIAEILPDANFAVDLDGMTAQDWKDDFEAIVEAAKDVEEFCDLDFKDLSKWDFSQDGIDAVKEAVEDILTLNILGDDANKTGLVEGVLHKLDIFTEEQLDMIDLSDVVWANEIENVQDLLDIVGELQNTEGFDLVNKDFDLNKLLENDDFIDAVIDALEVIVDSDLLMDIAPAAIDKFVKPAVEKLDDEDGTINGILDSLTTEELVQEVEKLMEVVRAAGQLHVLEVPTKGVSAIDWANTDALHTIVNGIFDSKIIEGNEGRVIRIILKATNILDVEKGALDGIDYDNEQAILNKAIDDLEEVLKDERFLEFDENGKLVISYGLYTSQKTLNSFFAALERLFGVWTPSSETDGSELVKALLPEAYDKYIKTIIPDALAEIIDIIGLDEATGDELMSDVRHIIYIGKTAVNAEMANYLTDGDYDFSNVDKAVGQILYAVFDMHCIKGNEAELVAYAINFAIDKTGIAVDHVTAEDFANVDWAVEVEGLTKLVADIVKLAVANDIATVQKALDFVKDKGYMDKALITNENILGVCDILEDIVDLQTVEVLLPIALVYGCDQAYKKGYNVDYLTKHVTEEQLVEDLKSIIELARVAVNEIGLVDYYKNGWTGELCENEAIDKALEILFNLNIVHGNEDDLLELAFGFVPANDYVKAEDLDFFYFANHKDQEIAALEGVLDVVFDFFEVNNIHRLEDAIALVKDKWYLDIDNLLKDYNVEIAAELVDAIAECDLVLQCVKAALPKVLEMPAITNILDASCIAEISKEELKEDLQTVADIIREANKLDVAAIWATKDLEPIDTTVIKNVLNMIGDLNIVNNYAAKLVPQAVNYVIGKTNVNINKTFTEADFADVDWAREFEVIGNTIEKTVELLEKNNLDSLQDIIKFVKNGDYKDPIIYTAENAVGVIDILSVALESQIIKSLAVVAIDWAIDLAVEKGIDIGFLHGRLTADDLIADLDVLLKIAQDLVDFGLVEYANTGDIVGIEVLPLVDAVSLFEQLHILTCANKEWTNLVVGILNDKVMTPIVGYTLPTSVDKYATVNYAHENQVLQNIVHEVGYLLRNLDLTKASEVIDFVKNIKDNATDLAIYNNRTAKNVAEVLSFAASSEIVKLYIVDLFNFGIDKVSALTGQDLAFLKNTVTADELENDIQVIGSMRDALLDFDLPRLIITGDVKEIKTTYIADVVAKLEDMYIFTNNNDAIASFAYNKIANILGIPTKSSNDFAAVDWAVENQLLCDIIEEAQNLLDAEGFKTVANIKDFIANIKFYSKLRSTYNDDAIESVENMVILACDSQAIKLGIVDLFDSAVRWATLTKNIDLSFLEGEFTADELTSDIKVAIDILNGVLDFGLLEILETYDLSDIDTTPIQNVIPLLENINVLKKHNKDWAAFVNNFVAPILKDKANITISEKNANDFAAIDFAVENAALVTIIDAAEDVLRAAGCNAFHDVKNVINNKTYAKQEFYTNEVCKAILGLVNAIDNSEIFASYLPELLEIGLGYVPAGLDVSFLRNKFTADELQADVHKLCEIGSGLVDLGIVELIFTKNIENFDAKALGNIVPKLEELNLTTKVNKEWTVLAYNIVAKMLGIPEKTTDAFTGVNYAAENALLVEVCNVVDKFMVIEGFHSINDIVDYAKGFNFKDLNAYDDGLVDCAQDLLEIAIKSKIVEVGIVELFEHALTIAKDKGIDLSFLSGEFDAAELFADVHTINLIIDELQAAQALQVAQAKSLEPLKVEHVADAIALLEQVHILKDCNREWSAFANNLVKPILHDKLGMEISSKSALDFAGIDYAHENGVLQDVVVLAKELIDATGAVTFAEIKAIIDNKEFTKKAFYTDEVVHAAINLVDGIDNSNIVAEYLPAALNFAADKVQPMMDISFVKDAFTAAELQADVHKLCEIAGDLVDLGIIEVVFDKKLSEIDAAGFAAVVPKLEDVNILTKLNKEWTALAYNMVGAKLGLDEKSASDFAEVTYPAENQLLVDALLVVGQFLSNEHLVSSDDVINWVNNFNYKQVAYYTDARIDTVEELLLIASDSKIIEIAIPELFEYGVKIAIDKGLELQFLQNQFNGRKLCEDIKVICDIIDEIQASDAKNCAVMQSLETLQVEHIANAIALLEDVHILKEVNRDWAAFANNMLKPILSDKVGIQISEKAPAYFTFIDFAHENEVLQDVVVLAKDLIDATGAVTFDDIKAIINEKQYMDVDFYTNAVVDAALALVNGIDNSNIVAKYLPDLLNWAVGLVPSSFDVSFLKDAFTAEELQSDVHVLCAIADKLVDLDVLTIALKREIGMVSPKGYAQVVPMLEDLNILTKVNKEWTALVYNLIADKLGIDTKGANDFVGVTYADENQLLVDALLLVDKLSVMENLKYAKDYIDWAQGFNYKDPNAYYKDLVDVAQDLLETALKSNILKVAIVDLFEKGVQFAVDKGYAVDFLSGKFTADELIADVYKLSEVINEVQVAGIVDFIYSQDIDDLQMNHITNIVGMLEEINILKKCNAGWAAFAYNMIAKGTGFAEKTAADFATVDFANENALLSSGLQYAYDLATALGITTIEEAKTYDYKSLARMDSDVNNYVKTVATILDLAASSDLLAEFAFPASARFVPSTLAGLADVHNIYATPQDLRDDIAAISLALKDVASLHLDFVVQYDNEFPFEQTAKVREILEGLFGLNYLNGPGRVEKMLTLIPGIDTSLINPNNIDLAGDGVLLADAYDELAKILTDPAFPIKKMSDLNSTINIDINYWMQPTYLDAARDTLTNIMNTTVVKETDGAILLVLVPLLRVFFPDYYDAIAPEECSAEELAEDFTTITNIVHDLLDAEWNNIRNGMIFIVEVRDLIVNTLTNIKNLNMTYGDGGAIIKCTLDRFDYKSINGFEIYANEWDTSHLNFQHDIDTLIDMVDAVYAFAYAEGIVYINDLMNYFAGFGANAKAELAKDIVIDTVETLVKDVTELSIVKFDSLQIYTLLKRANKFAILNDALLDLTGLYGSSIELDLDLVHVANMISQIKALGFTSMMAGDPIDFDQADEVKALIAEFTSMVYVNAKFVDIFNKIDSLVPAINFTDYVDPTEINVVNDFAILGEIYEVLVPALMSENNDYKTLTLHPTLYKEHLKNLVYSYQHAIAEVIDLAADITVAPGLVKLLLAKYDANIPAAVKDYVDLLHIDAIDNEVLRNDLHILSDVVEDLAGTTILGYVLFQYDIDLSDKDAYVDLAEDVFKLYMIDNNIRPLLSQVCYQFNIDGVYLGGIDYEAEEAMIVNLIGNGLEVLYSCDLYTASDVVDHYGALYKAIKAGVKAAIDDAKGLHVKAAIKDALRPVVNELRDMDVDATVRFIDNLLSLQLVKAFGLPLYDKFVVSGRTGLTATIVKLDGYTDNMFAEDVDTMKFIVDTLADSEIYHMLNTKALPGTQVIPYLEDVVRAICNLNVLNVKIADAGEIGQGLLERFGLVDRIESLVHVTVDLTKYDWSTINFAVDADQYAAMVQYGYVALDELLHNGLNLGYFGDQTAMQAVAEIYALAMDTNLGEFATDRIINAVAKVAPKLHMSVTADHDTIRDNTVDFFFGLVQIGFFSNNGIDLTNTALVNSLKNDVLESINLPSKLVKVINKVCARAYCYGVIPFTWENASARTEAKIVRDAAKMALDVVRPNLSNVTALNFSFLADATTQAKVEQVADKLAESALLSQLVFPVIEGTYKALTLSVNGTLVYDTNMTVEELFNNCFNDLWKIVDDVNVIAGLDINNMNINLFKFDEMKDVIHTLVNNCMVKGAGNFGSVLAVALKKVVKLELTDEQVAALIAIDYTADMAHIENALDTLKATYVATGFAYSADILKDATAAAGFGDAIKEMLNSEAVKVVIRTLITKLVDSKLASVDGDIYNFVSDRLADPAYTDALLINDLTAICNLLDDLANTNILSNTSDFGAWDYTAIKTIVNGFFDLNMVDGFEDYIMKPAIKKIPTVKDYYDDSMVIADWKAELITIINGLEGLVNDGQADIANIDINMVSGTTLDYLCDSVIISSVVLDTINNKIIDLGLATSAVVTKEDLDAVTDWNKEITAITNLTDLMDTLDHTNTFHTVVTEFNATYTDLMANTVLVKKVFLTCAPELIDSIPVVKDYATQVDTSAWGNAEWNTELDAIVAAMVALDGHGINGGSISYTVNTDNLDANAVTKMLDSKILTKAVVSEFNSSLTASGINYTITESELNSVTNWAEEISAITALKDAADESPRTNATIKHAYDVANTTVLCKNILGAYASTLLPTVPFVATYIGGVDTTSWTATTWYNELGAVLNAYEAANAIGATDLAAPLTTLAGHGEVPAAAVQSIILKNAMVTEMNANVATSFEPGLITVTMADIDAIGTTAADWNNEIGKINALKTALDNFAANPTDPAAQAAALIAANDAKTNSVIGKKIAEAKGY